MHKPLDNTNVALNFKTLNCIGIDESGKGDYFGPLVVAAVYVKNQEMVEKLISLGVKDSKSLKDDKIQQIAKEIFKICDSEVLWFYPRTYNVRYKVFNNLNKMLAWAHAKSLEKVLIRNPDCDIAVSDQFANKDLLINSLKANGKLIQLIQRPKAEENIAVAAASILARNQFVQRLKEMNKAYKHTFSKGAGPHIIGEGLDFAIKGGKIMDVAKLHFKTTKKIEEKYYEITKKKLMFD